MITDIDLDKIQVMVHDQAVKKGWKTEALYCIKRAFQELKELQIAVEQGRPVKEILLEVIDVLYFIVQVAQDKAPTESLTKAFLEKYEDNWIQKKKTEDENGKQVRR